MVHLMMILRYCDIWKDYSRRIRERLYPYCIWNALGRKLYLIKHAIQVFPIHRNLIGTVRKKDLPRVRGKDCKINDKNNGST